MDAAIALKASGSLAVIADDGLELTYADLVTRVDDFAGRIPRRSVVMVLTTRRLPALIGVIACLSRDLVLLPVDAGLDADRVKRLVDGYRPDFLWRPDGGGYVLDDLRGSRGDRPDPHPDLALLLSTSGSTGHPKMVRISGANVRANAAAIASCLGLVPSDRYISTLPLDHTYGISMVTASLQAGAAILVTERTPVQREFWEFFRQAGASVMGGVPYSYEMLRRLGFLRRQLPSLRVLSAAGGKLSDDLQREFSAYAAREGKSLVLMYGQSEATALMASLSADRAAERIGSIGTGCGGRLRLVGDDGEEIAAPGVTGEIVFSGPGVSLGYAESGADLARGDERGGSLASGDLAKYDEDGFLYVVGRRRRFLKLQGNRINLDAVEELVREAFPSVECACVGTDERMRIFVAGAGADPVSGIRTLVSDRTGLSASLFEVIPRESIPRTAAGKTAYSELTWERHS